MAALICMIVAALLSSFVNASYYQKHLQDEELNNVPSYHHRYPARYPEHPSSFAGPSGRATNNFPAYSEHRPNPYGQNKHDQAYHGSHYNHRPSSPYPNHGYYNKIHRPYAPSNDYDAIQPAHDSIHHSNPTYSLDNYGPTNYANSGTHGPVDGQSHIDLSADDFDNSAPHVHSAPVPSSFSGHEDIPSNGGYPSVQSNVDVSGDDFVNSGAHYNGPSPYESDRIGAADYSRPIVNEEAYPVGDIGFTSPTAVQSDVDITADDFEDSAPGHYDSPLPYAPSEGTNIPVSTQFSDPDYQSHIDVSADDFDDSPPILSGATDEFKNEPSLIHVHHDAPGHPVQQVDVDIPSSEFDNSGPPSPIFPPIIASSAHNEGSHAIPIYNANRKYPQKSLITPPEYVNESPIPHPSAHEIPSLTQEQFSPVSHSIKIPVETAPVKSIKTLTPTSDYSSHPIVPHISETAPIKNAHVIGLPHVHSIKTAASPEIKTAVPHSVTLVDVPHSIKTAPSAPVPYAGNGKVIETIPVHHGLPRIDETIPPQLPVSQQSPIKSISHGSGIKSPNPLHHSQSFPVESGHDGFSGSDSVENGPHDLHSLQLSLGPSPDKHLEPISDGAKDILLNSGLDISGVFPPSFPVGPGSSFTPGHFGALGGNPLPPFHDGSDSFQPQLLNAQPSNLQASHSTLVTPVKSSPAHSSIKS